MEIISHRINSVDQLINVNKKYGTEFDVRYHEDSLVLHHEPFGHHKKPFPEKFEDYLASWDHGGPMIVNVKTEGIEKKCIELITKRKIKTWFFLDLSMPYFVIYSRYAEAGTIEGFSPDNLAVRFSEFEPIEYALAFKGRARWVWVDCFTRLPLDHGAYKKLKESGFKICIVAPELQKHPAEWAEDFRKQLAGMEIDAVCTKRPDLWE